MNSASQPVPRTLLHPAPAIPPEWAPHRAMWTAWPHNPREWLGKIDEARNDVEAMVRALASGGETVRVLACGGKEVIEEAKARLQDVAEIIVIPFGDIWLRDTGPIFGRDEKGKRVAHLFRFNGWGGKYVMQNDDGVNAAMAKHVHVSTRAHDFILEGGSIDLDGTGLCLSTRQCLMNPNRNRTLTAPQAEKMLSDSLGVKKVLWLDEGLLGDHTDGHIDNIARFVAPGTVVCQSPSGEDDPNAAILFSITSTLAEMTDLEGKPLKIKKIPSPGLVADKDGDPVAASHMNFIIGNKAVVVPVYNEHGKAAVEALKPLFPGREVIGINAHGVLVGGGSFHCITQQEPE
jgi:agmatine deiminase